MLNNFAVIFPGQGSQFVGMLSELAAIYPVVEETFAEASDIANQNLWQLAQQGPAETLAQTVNTQSVMLAADIALWRLWQQSHTMVPQYVAGHSLGEYAALVAADVMSFAAAMQLVCARGQLMQEAMLGHKGAMAAIIGLEDAVVTELCVQASGEHWVSPANYNSVKQIVVSGHLIAVEKLIVLAKEQGAKIAKLLPVSVAAHCQLMSSANDAFAKELASVEFHKPQVKLLHNVDVGVYTEGDIMRQKLLQQLTAPVQWVKIIQAMLNEGITHLLECGPGTVLAGLNKRIDRSIITLNYDTLERVEQATNLVKEWDK